MRRSRIIYCFRPSTHSTAMGARLCCCTSRQSQTPLKRSELSIDNSTASEPNSLPDEMTKHVRGDPVDSNLMTRSADSDACTRRYQPSVRSHRTNVRNSIGCQCRSHLPRVNSGGLTPIEEEPEKRRPSNHEVLGRPSTVKRERSRTRSSDSLESAVSSSFGSMRNYQRFVMNRA
jgi:hypothetical protein